MKGGIRRQGYNGGTRSRLNNGVWIHSKCKRHLQRKAAIRALKRHRANSNKHICTRCSASSKSLSQTFKACPSSAYGDSMMSHAGTLSPPGKVLESAFLMKCVVHAWGSCGRKSSSTTHHEHTCISRCRWYTVSISRTKPTRSPSNEAMHKHVSRTHPCRCRLRRRQPAASQGGGS